jgi:hypothetical protein
MISVLANTRLTTVCVLSFLLAASAQERTQPACAAVRQIAIQSRWGGLGPSRKTELIIRNENGVYRLDGSVIETSAVVALNSAVLESPLPTPSAANFGLTKGWLEATSDDLLKNAKRGAENDSLYWAMDSGIASQKMLFRESYSNPDLIGKALSDLYRSRHTDDNPSVCVTLSHSDGSSIVVSSNSQGEYMLPWKIERPNGSFETFNRNISIALANLLPKEATNRERIAGDGFALALAKVVFDDIENQWRLLRAEDKDRTAIEDIGRVYTLIGADVNRHHDVTFGVYSEKNGSEEENLHVNVRGSRFPPNLTEESILLYEGGKVRGVDDFLTNANRYEELVLSVPWLKRLWARNPDWPTTLLWVHDSSFSDKAMLQFAADMHKLGRDKLAVDVRKVQHDVALLNIRDGDWWLVLPDKRMVLWRYESVSGLLGFKQSQVSPVECTDYQGVTGGCVGAVVSSAGKLER